MSYWQKKNKSKMASKKTRLGTVLETSFSNGTPPKHSPRISYNSDCDDESAEMSFSYRQGELLLFSYIEFSLQTHDSVSPITKYANRWLAITDTVDEVWKVAQSCRMLTNSDYLLCIRSDAAFFTLLEGITGTGMLAYPLAFKNTGLYVRFLQYNTLGLLFNFGSSVRQSEIF